MILRQDKDIRRKKEIISKTVALFHYHNITLTRWIKVKEKY